jgi:hypothetical protein
MVMRAPEGESGAHDAPGFPLLPVGPVERAVQAGRGRRARIWASSRRQAVTM